MILKKSHQGSVEFKQKKLKEKGKQVSGNEINIASTDEVQLLDFSLRDENDKEVNYIVSEHVLKICFTVKSTKNLEEPHYGFILRNKYGLSAFGTNTYTMRQKTTPVDKNETVDVEFSFECNLISADYSISIGVGNKGYDRGTFEEYMLFHQDIDMIKVIENKDAICYEGYTNLKPNVEIVLNK